jgi:hypothetical protein
MPIGHESDVTIWGNSATTLGSVGLIGIVAQGSDASTRIVIKDGTDIKYAPVIATTQLLGFLFAYKPVAFRNLITTITGTCSYSITYYPRPE